MKPDVAIIGAGYVGVPLAHVFAEAGKRVLLVDTAESVVSRLNRGESHIDDVPSETLARHVQAGMLAATSDYDGVRDADAVLVALPTPLSKQREPDLSVVVGGDFFLAFSPERVDPGNRTWTMRNVPKVVGGISAACTKRAAELYAVAVESVYEVSTPEAAELTKLLENIFRSVNIALVNELAQLCERMGISVWEVVDAAATKPFGFMSFKPGPGLGGHCIPIDPFYLT